MAKGKQDRQCTYNGTLKCVRATIVAVERHKYYIFWVCVCSLRYPACNAHAPRRHLACLALQYFSTSSHQRHDFLKKVIEHEVCVLIFFTTFVWNILHSKNWARYDDKCILVFMYNTRYSCQLVMKREFYRQIFEKYSNINFMKIHLVESEVLHLDIRQDRRGS